MEIATKTPEPVYFWRPFEEHGYLGQWYLSPFTEENVTFQNCETYMMYHKAILFDDPEVAEEIIESAEDPKAVKALGRKVKGFNQKTWDEKKFEIVVKGNRAKFRQNAALKKSLLETQGREIIEASPMDRIWGIGFSQANALKNKHRWGQNLLGKALMQVRDELLPEES